MCPNPKRWFAQEPEPSSSRWGITTVLCSLLRVLAYFVFTFLLFELISSSPLPRPIRTLCIIPRGSRVLACGQPRALCHRSCSCMRRRWPWCRRRGAIGGGPTHNDSSESYRRGRCRVQFLSCRALYHCGPRELRTTAGIPQGGALSRSLFAAMRVRAHPCELL